MFFARLEVLGQAWGLLQRLRNRLGSMFDMRFRSVLSFELVGMWGPGFVNGGSKGGAFEKLQDEDGTSA